MGGGTNGEVLRLTSSVLSSAELENRRRDFAQIGSSFCAILESCMQIALLVHIAVMQLMSA